MRIESWRKRAFFPEREGKLFEFAAHENIEFRSNTVYDECIGKRLMIHKEEAA